MRVKIHIVAPYDSMVSVIKECIPLFPTLEINYSVGDLDEGVKQAIQAEKNGAEIVISRGGTAQLIKKSVHIPVLAIQLSGYDMIRSLTLANDLGSKTAIVGFSNITSGAQSIIDLLDFPLKVFTISDSDEVAPLILKLKNSGYHQIIGDVITMKTSFSYGLQGMLIQSGKESIVAALEDAKLLHGHLQAKSNLTKVFEKLILKETNNFIIIDDKNKIIYERWTDFDSNPLNADHLNILNTELEINNKIIGNFIVDDNVIDYIGYYFSVQGQPYKVFAIGTISIPILEQAGLTIHSEVASELISATSPLIKKVINHVETLYKNNEIILLQGRTGTGKEFLTHYIHRNLSEGGMFLTINMKEFNSKDLKNLPLKNISTIKLTHLEYIGFNEEFSSFIKECLKYHVRIFIITENVLHSDLNQDIKVNKILLPDLSDRTEDIRTLAQYFIAYFHQEYGTRAVKINSEALQLLERSTYPNNIDDLKKIIKQVVLNTNDYVIQKETIEKFLSNNNLPTNIVFQKGTLKEIEKEIIKWVLKEEKNNQTKAAERLGISRATLWRKLKD